MQRFKIVTEVGPNCKWATNCINFTGAVKNKFYRQSQFYQPLKCLNNKAADKSDSAKYFLRKVLDVKVYLRLSQEPNTNNAQPRITKL